MKLGVNLTTGYDDTSRFRDTEDLSSFLETLDGVELMCLDEPDKGLVTPKQVLGLHMSSYYNWLDFWEGNEEGLVHDFGSVEAAESFLVARPVKPSWIAIAKIWKMPTATRRNMWCFM